MIRDLIKEIKSLFPGLPETPVVHPEKFNDAVALRTSWQCLKSGSANFTTHRLVKTAENDLIYRSTILPKIFGMSFLAVGLAMLIGYTSAMISHLILPVIGLFFTIIGIVIAIQSMIPIGFNRQERLFYRGFGKKGNAEIKHKSNATAFGEIHAIQILTKIGTVSSGSDNYHQDHYFYAYELNLVLHDGKRKYVMTYINLNQALMDANLITELIRVPVWNSIVE